MCELLMKLNIVREAMKKGLTQRRKERMNHEEHEGHEEFKERFSGVRGQFHAETKNKSHS